jgi:hypothetical protein
MPKIYLFQTGPKTAFSFIMCAFSAVVKKTHMTTEITSDAKQVLSEMLA